MTGCSSVFNLDSIVVTKIYEGTSKWAINQIQIGVTSPTNPVSQNGCDFNELLYPFKLLTFGHFCFLVRVAKQSEFIIKIDERHVTQFNDHNRHILVPNKFSSSKMVFHIVYYSDESSTISVMKTLVSFKNGRNFAKSYFDILKQEDINILL